MKKFRKFTDYLEKNRWIVGSFLYIALCVYMYFTASLTIEGVALPQHDAGILSLAVWHGMILFAFAMAWLLHKSIDNIVKIRDYFRKIKRNKE